MDADAEPHLLADRSISILPTYGVLNLDGTLHDIYGAGKVGDETVTRRVEDPTAMRGDQAIDDDPVRGEGAKGADLIEPHQAAVAFDVGGEDRGELPFDRVRFQPRHLPDHYSPTGREIRASVNHSDARWWCMSVAEGDRRAQARQRVLETCRWIRREKGCDVSAVRW